MDYHGWLRDQSKQPSVEWPSARQWLPAQPSVEDEMRAEIARLRTEVDTLKATLAMVRSVLAQTVANLVGA